jgi:predicted esterase
VAGLTRRIFAACAAAFPLAACARAAGSVRIAARPGAGGKLPKPGVHALKLRTERDALLYVPESVPADRPAPLLVYLHGATGNEQQGIRRMTPYADEFHFLLLSPASEDGTWDAIREAYGPDVRFIDRALDQVFRECPVDPQKVGVCGFSDGASYALGLGMSNGELFGSIMAFSPGFVPPGVQPSGNPRLFLSHGTADQILPIEQCSRALVPRLTRAGYKVTYREFDGPHTLPPDIASVAMRWFLG